MAERIPSTLPSRTPRGAERLHQLFGRLPDDVVVFADLGGGGEGDRPCFIGLSPRSGAWVVEVASWNRGSIRFADRSTVSIGRDGGEDLESHPLASARRRVRELARTTAGSGFGDRFLNPDGEHAGDFRFPVGTIAVLPNITRDQLDREGAGGASLADLFAAPQVVTRDQLDAWDELTPEELEHALLSCISPSWPIAPLTDDETNALRAIIHPEMTFEHQVSLDRLGDQPPAIREQAGVVVELDERQRGLATAVGSGHRVVYGVAGSGKTLLLLARARHLLESAPGTEVLLTCYNRTLATWLEHELAGARGVTVRHFHRWAAENGVAFEPESDDASFGEELLEALRAGARDAGRFDAVLVDEAQDFEPVWFQCLLAAMKDPADGDLLIVADGSQGLYRRSKTSWAQIGIKAQGRSASVQFELDRNYRNPTEVIALAETFAQADAQRLGDSPTAAGTEDGLAPVRVSADSCVRSTGVSPAVTLAEDREAELDHAEHLVRELLAGRWDGRTVAPLAPEQVAVLYPAATEDEKVLLSLFAERLSDSGVPVAWLTQPSVYHPQDRVTAPGVKLQTIHSAKGLQYRAVIVVFADKLPRYVNRNAPGARLADRRLLYVAMTRAESFLAISASRPSEFVDDLTASPAAHVVGAAGSGGNNTGTGATPATGQISASA